MLSFHGKYPKLDPKSCVMPGAELAGDVELKEYASILLVLAPSSPLVLY